MATPVQAGDLEPGWSHDEANGSCIASIAEATADETAGRWLLEGAERIENGSYAVRVAHNLLADGPGERPGPSCPGRARPARGTANKPVEAKRGAGALHNPHALAAQSFPHGSAAGLHPDSGAEHPPVNPPIALLAGSRAKAHEPLGGGGRR
jgi:hypothetical protein